MHKFYQTLGHSSWLVVGRKMTHDPTVLAIDSRGRGRSLLGRIKMSLEYRCGWQYLDYPGSHRIPGLVGQPFDILHLHNLHGGFFDISALPVLSRKAVTVLTLHDCWPLTGHCSYPFHCERWKIGCGRCPDLSIYPRILKDGTRFNSLRKRLVFRSSRFSVVTPSKWLFDRTGESLLKRVPRRLVHNGIDFGVFKPGVKAQAREKLGLPMERPIVLLVSNLGLKNTFKDVSTLLEAFRLLIQQSPSKKQPLLLVLGARSELVNLGYLNDYVFQCEFVSDERTLTAYYQACDLLVHPSKVESFSLTILEAMACGTPVVSSAVGAIPELVEHGRSGFLVQPGDALALTNTIREILENPQKAQTLAQAACKVVRQKFSIQEQARKYLELYGEFLAKKKG